MKKNIWRFSGSRMVVVGCVALGLVPTRATIAADPVQVRVDNNPVQNVQVGNQAFQQIRQNARVVSDRVRPMGPLTAAKIRRAIDNAIQFIRTRQRPDGSIGAHDAGSTALGALALLAAGVDPVGDESLQKALNWLAGKDTDNTYVRGIQANVWEYALRKAPRDERLRAALKTDYEWLLKSRGQREAWRYVATSSDWDNSCSQYGVLGIWAAARAGMDSGDGFWRDMAAHFLKCQDKDGGWGYTTGGSSHNMTTAGLASMFLVFDMVYGKTCYSRENPQSFTSGDAAKCLQSIASGMDWFQKRGVNCDDSYFLYGIERVGVAGGRKYIGEKDWFKEGAVTALGAQRADGAILLGSWGDDVVKTAFSTLFLVYGGAPVAFNKLEYGNNPDWNLNPRDLANLTKDLWSAYEQPLNWSSVSIAAPAEEFEAPILLITGSAAVQFAPADVAKLRSYVRRGGTIFAEASDRSPAFTASMRQLLGDLFPTNDYPGIAWQPLPPDHGLFTVLRQSWDRTPALSGASDGSRTFFFLSDEYFTGDWQLNRTGSDAFRLGMNLLFYATDLTPLPGKFATTIPDRPASEANQRQIKVARVRFGHAGVAPMDWDAALTSWQSFAPYFRHVTGTGLEEVAPVDLESAPDAGIGLLHLTGRAAIRLSAGERQRLKEYVEAGGTVLVDAYAGAGAFGRAARSELEAIFGKLTPLDSSTVVASGRFKGGQDLTRGLRLKLPARKEVAAQGGQAQAPQLEVALIQGRPAVYFSRFDLSAALAGVETYRCVGYKPESARRIAANILGYLAMD